MDSARTATTLLRQLSCALFLALVGAMVAVPGSAQQGTATGGDNPLPIDADMRGAIIDSITSVLNERYVFEDVAEEIEKHIRKKLRKHEYDEFTSIADFARALSEDVREVSHDKHLGVRYASPDMVERLMEEDEDPKIARQRELESMKSENFMFRKAELLDGNVGYLRLDAFVDAALSGPTATAAMNFLANCDALIIDLRQNGGGSPSLIQYMTAYFLDEPTHLNSFYTREGDSIEQYWSAPYVPGPKMTETDLYVLTSLRTFSGAEEFTYNLKNLERATIVGETTGGGAHPIDFKLFPSLNVGMTVPYARAVNPISGTNWEGVGVSPHIDVPSNQALDVAHLEALKKLRKTEQEKQDVSSLDWAIEGLEAKLNPVEVGLATLASYAGNYGPRKLTLEDGTLVYQRDEGPVMRAIPMAKKLFRFEEINYFRLEVITDDSGRPVKLIGHYEGGHTDESPRT